jgi:hypothetical protein
MQTKKIVLIGVSILSFITGIYYLFRANDLPTDLSQFYSTADGLAELTKKHVGGSGSILFITEEGSKITKDRNDRFKELVNQSGIQIVAKELVSEEELFAGSDQNPEILEQRGIPTEKFFSLLQKYPDVKLIVSFVGPPVLTQEDFERLPQNPPQMIVYSDSRKVMGLGTKELISDGLVNTFVVPNPELVPINESLSMMDKFRICHYVYTTENIDTFWVD